MSAILVIEDDPILSQGLRVLLSLEGYKTRFTTHLADAEQLLNESIALVLLDINLPDGCGFDFLKKIRIGHPRLPVIILTARVEECAVVYGLEQGANDYIRKPFGNRELIARINSILKHTTALGNKLCFGDLELLLEQRQLSYHGMHLNLNRREFDILKYLFEKQETIVTRDCILHNIDQECRMLDRTIDSHISHLRNSFKKIGVNQIKITSVYGIGYKLEKI